MALPKKLLQVSDPSRGEFLQVPDPVRGFAREHSYHYMVANEIISKKVYPLFPLFPRRFSPPRAPGVPAPVPLCGARRWRAFEKEREPASSLPLRDDSRTGARFVRVSALLNVFGHRAQAAKSSLLPDECAIV